jgi:hypothetical protein
MGDRLQVRVNDELMLDAGTYEEATDSGGCKWLVHPPERTLFHQVLAYLQAKPDPPPHHSGTMIGREGVAAAALVLRWGSYLAVLLDHDKPIWPAVRSPGTSRISDDEMARINIEASGALAEWIDIYRGDPRLYQQVVDRAFGYLPMPNRTASKLKVKEFSALAIPEMAARVVQAADAERLARVQADADRWPSRIFANALVNTAWRNGPVEDVHAGYVQGYPLARRRVTPEEERELMCFASDGMALGMSVCWSLASEHSRRSWPERVLPYGLAELLMITPSRWTLTETSREIRLPATTTHEAPPHPPT